MVSAPSAPTSIWILPSACTPSQWTWTSGWIARAARAASATGWMVPISLLTSMSATTWVSSRIAPASSSGEMTPSLETGTSVASQPARHSCAIDSRTAECSMAE